MRQIGFCHFPTSCQHCQFFCRAPLVSSRAHLVLVPSMAHEEAHSRQYASYTDLFAVSLLSNLPCLNRAKVGCDFCLDLNYIYKHVSNQIPYICNERSRIMTMYSQLFLRWSRVSRLFRESRDSLLLNSVFSRRGRFTVVSCWPNPASLFSLLYFSISFLPSSSSSPTHSTASKVSPTEGAVKFAVIIAIKYWLLIHICINFS